MDVIQRIIKTLPYVIIYQGAAFTFEIFHNINQLRMGYILTSVDADSPHFDDWKQYGSWENPFASMGFGNFLYLQENIETVAELDSMVQTMHTWLVDNGLVERPAEAERNVIYTYDGVPIPYGGLLVFRQSVSDKYYYRHEGTTRYITDESIIEHLNAIWRKNGEKL